MTDREKLIELLGDDVCKHDSCDDCDCQGSTDMCIATLKVAMANHLIANGVTVQKWIPVTERLPKVGSRVVACGEKGGVFIVKAEGETTGFGRMDGASKYRSFTHWTPIPEPPKE